MAALDGYEWIKGMKMSDFRNWDKTLLLQNSFVNWVEDVGWKMLWTPTEEDAYRDKSGVVEEVEVMVAGFLVELVAYGGDGDGEFGISWTKLQDKRFGYSRLSLT